MRKILESKKQNLRDRLISLVCSFQLARRDVILGYKEVRFWDWRLANIPSEQLELERRLSLTI